MSRSGSDGFAARVRRHVFRGEAAVLWGRLVTHRGVLLAVTRVELGKRYAGSFLGPLWYPLYWAMLLGMYCFVYLVVLRQRIPEFGEFEYVVFIFSGLVPYFGISDAIGSGASSIRSNLAIVRNAVFAVELIPVKSVLVALVSQAVAVGILVIVALSSGFLGWHLLYLPIPFIAEFLFATGVVLVLSALNVAIPDIQQVTTLTLWFLLFVSPVGFTIAQVPPGYRWIIWLNPLTYLIEEFRFAILGVRTFNTLASVGGLVAVAILFFVAGGTVFHRLMAALSDYQ